MELSFKGGCREVGRSALLVNEEVLIDYGIKAGEIPEYPLNGLRPRSVLISHGHLDHCGAVANLVDLEPEIFMTPPTKDLANMLATDTLSIAEKNGMTPPFNEWDVQQASRMTTAVDVEVPFKTSGYNTCFYRAGHIPGAACIHLEKDGKSLLYTGDISTIDTRLVPGAKELPDADALIIESTYFNEDHPPRKETENAFIDSLQETLDTGGNVIIPAFAIGRTQEILMLLNAHGIDAYVDGMGSRVYRLFMDHPEYLKDPSGLKSAFDRATIVRGRKRKNVPLDSSVIVTTAGMLNGGPILYYLNKLHNDPKSKIMLTGYQVEGTNGRMAQDNGIIENDGVIQQLRNKIEKYDFSAHCGDSELKDLVRSFCDRGTETVFVMHGENSADFAQWISEEIGVTAHAPENGEKFSI